jgi:phosphohistidine phosphatase
MTTLLLIRHGIAEEAEIAAAAGIPDHLRPLTAKGKKRMRRIAVALADMMPELELIASSPLRRAMQTAEILAEARGKTPLVQTDALAPGAPPEAILEFLHHRRVHGPLALVGHEPDLGQWAGWALCGEARSFMQFKKGGAALLHFPGLPAPGRAELGWLLTPEQLRELD